MGWHPEGGFIPTDWIGYNEAMILYVLALGSPTHAVDATAWSKWVSGYQWGTFRGQSYVQFGPLFGHERSEEHTSELQSLAYLVCRLLLEKKKKKTKEVIVDNTRPTQKRVPLPRGV